MVAWFVKKSRRPCQNLVQIRISAAFSAGGDFFTGLMNIFPCKYLQILLI